MNQLEELKKLYVKTKTYKIPKEPKEGEVQATIIIRPLDISESSNYEVDESASKEEKAKQTMELVALSLGESVEDIKKLSMAYMTELMEAIIDVNNISTKQQTSIKKVLEEKRKKLHETS